jgi:integrase
MGNNHHVRPQKGTYIARLGVPADVQHAFDTKQLTMTTRIKVPHEAEAMAVAAPVIARWKRDFEAIRQGTQKAVKDEWTRLANEYRRHRGKPLDDAGAALVLNVIGFVMRHVEGQPATKVSDIWRDTTSLTDAFAMLPRSGKAEDAFAQITGKATPFPTYLGEYQTHAKVQGKSLLQVVSNIKKFAVAVRQPIEQLTGGHVQAWLYGLKSEKSGEAADEKTKQRKLSELRGYWNHLVAMGHVSDTASNPFLKRITANKETESEAQARERQAYKPADVPLIWRRASVEGDPELSDLIQLAAYSGMRLSEIMNLRASSVIMDDGITCIHVSTGKTRAARRTFPVHPDISGLVAKLVKEAGTGFLITCESKNRSDTMSKRFGRLKTAMKYGDAHVFHSLRHTVVGLFREANCPLEVRNKLLGHEDGDETSGAGAGYGDLTAKGRLDWMVKAIRYPDS